MDPAEQDVVVTNLLQPNGLVSGYLAFGHVALIDQAVANTFGVQLVGLASLIVIEVVATNN